MRYYSKKLLRWICERGLLAVLVALCGCGSEVKPPAPVYPIPTEAQMKWHEMETNAFIHFGLNTFTDKEWGYGDESPSLFNPTSLDTDQWAHTLKAAGFKTVILTCKHHDGFCLWPSAYTEHSVKNSPYKHGKGDIVAELSHAAKKEGLMFGIYVSPWDRNRADYGAPSYIQYYRNQLTELFSKNSPIVEMWFDGANGGDGFYGGAREVRNIQKTNYYNWPATLTMVRTLQPEIIFFSDAGPGVRWVGNERGEAGETNWNNITIDTLYAGQAGIESLLNTGSENGTSWVPAEVDVSIRPGWFYHAREDSLVKRPEVLMNIYLSSVGRGSTLLLNVPPDNHGLIHGSDVKALMEWRSLLTKTFQKNLAKRATVIAGNVRGNSSTYAAKNIVDDNKETYWSTDDAILSDTLEIKLEQKSVISFILLQEYIKLGQRIKKFKVRAHVNNEWKTIGNGTTIGYKRILKTSPVETDRIQIVIEASKACPVISTVGLY